MNANDNNNNNEASKDKRHLFFAAVMFKTPVEGTIRVFARDKAHASEILHNMLNKREDLVVVDVFTTEELMNLADAEGIPAAEDVIPNIGDSRERMN